jgi:hypothetical protein
MSKLMSDYVSYYVSIWDEMSELSEFKTDLISNNMATGAVTARTVPHPFPR